MAKVNSQLEPVEIGMVHLDQVADALYKRLQDDEKETAKKIESLLNGANQSKPQLSNSL